MRIADDVAAPLPDCRIRYERGEPMAAVSGEPNQIDWSVRRHWLFVDHGVVLTAIRLPARFALRRRDRTLLNSAAIFAIQFVAVEAECRSRARHRDVSLLSFSSREKSPTRRSRNGIVKREVRSSPNVPRASRLLGRNPRPSAGR